MPSEQREKLNLQLDDVGMSEKLQIFDLPLHPASHITTDELLPSNDLQSHLLVRHPVRGQLHLSKGAFSQRTDNMVGADPLLGLLLRCRLNRSVVVAILRSTTARIWGLVLCATVRRGCKRNLELPIIVRAVRHHGGVCWLLFGVVGGEGTDCERRRCPTTAGRQAKIGSSLIDGC